MKFELRSSTPGVQSNRPTSRESDRRSPATEPNTAGGQSALPQPRSGEGDGLLRTLSRIRPFTMVPDDFLVDLGRQVEAILSYRIPGDFVECGVWRGGASFLIADLLREAREKDRTVWLFDSFEGMPAPKAIDGEAALAWASNTDDPLALDNARASLGEVRQAAAELGLASRTKFVKGWFEESLPVHSDQIGPIALLRIDADWYSSVKCCLDNLYDQVVDGGIIVFDDYYAFDGCATAVHEFLGGRQLSHRIETIVGTSGGYEAYQGTVIRKNGGTWKRMRDLHVARDEIERLVPPTETVIFVDDQELIDDIALNLPTTPFLERRGEYWGAPPDDASAIGELERLRRAGARAIVFTWPSFWWLDYYSELHAYLRSRFCCLAENERLIAFDLSATDG